MRPADSPANGTSHGRRLLVILATVGLLALFLAVLVRDLRHSKMVSDPLATGRSTMYDAQPDVPVTTYANSIHAVLSTADNHALKVY